MITNDLDFVYFDFFFLVDINVNDHLIFAG